MLNSFQLIANVGKDAEFNAQRKSCNFTACYTESYKKGDEWVNVPHWFFVSFRSEFAEQYAKKVLKGVSVVIEGQIKTYEKEGVKNFFVDARSVREVKKSEPKLQAAAAEIFAPIAEQIKTDRKPIVLTGDQTLGGKSDDDLPF